MATAFRAYAKINLGLLVLERRADGYHNICTVFHRIGIYDDIRFEASDRIEVVSSSSAAPGNESNLCFKAATALQAQCDGKQGVRIYLRKNIPVGAGLGGGSSDAATVLRMLPGFWGVTVESRVLSELASRLGSDVPYFLGNGSAVATGRGEILEYFSLDLPFTVLVCHPGMPVSTAWAYGEARPSGRRPCDLRKILARGMNDPPYLRQQLRNEFEDVVFGRFPRIREVKETLVQRGAVYASLSGSGSAVFGFFSAPAPAASLAGELEARGYGVWTTPPYFRPELE